MTYAAGVASPDLFAASASEAGQTTHTLAPLAVRMRPRSLEEVRGQEEVLRVGSPLRRLIEGSGGRAGPVSAILWGPPGTGKTTLAHLVASAAGREFVELSAVTAGVKDVRAVMDQAARNRELYERQTVLFLDEIHRFTKAQQDALLPGVENRQVILVAATTENPSFSVIAPLLSRSVLITLKSLNENDIREVIDAALAAPEGLAAAYELSAEAREHLVRVSGGDARRALTALEAAAGVAEDNRGVRGEAGTTAIEVADVEQAVAHAAVRYDRAGDQHYDVASALIKSMRGSDVDAALHYLARMLEAGEDPRFVARRLMISASEDVGMAAPGVLQTCVAAAQAVQLLGMPEARITLAHATIAAATAPKSNACYLGIDRAIADVRAGRGTAVPAHLRDAHYAGAESLGHGVGYLYPHDFPHGIVAQQYLPDDLVEARYYTPTTHGAEAAVAERLAAIAAATGAASSARVTANHSEETRS